MIQVLSILGFLINEANPAIDAISAAVRKLTALMNGTAVDPSDEEILQAVAARKAAVEAANQTA